MIQYKLKAAGKVIQIGTEIKGINTIYFLNLRIIEEVFMVDVICMLRREIIPPAKGRIPVGSGDDKSLNQRKPSLRILG